MTVRLWLMLADCWQCEACIELTEAQQHEAQRVLERHQAHAPARLPRQRETMAAAAVPARDAVDAGPTIRGCGPPPDSCPTRASRTLPTNRWHRRAARRRGARAADQASTRPTRCRSGSTHLLKNMPAWLISLLFHILLLTILGLLTQPAENGPYITLSMRVSHTVRDGGYTRSGQLARRIRVRPGRARRAST